METELLCAPEEIQIEEPPKKKKSHPKAAALSTAAACLILCLVSGFVHFSIIREAVDMIGVGWQNRLVAMVFPSLELKVEKTDKAEDFAIEVKEEETVAPLYITKDLSSSAHGGLSISNETSYNPDLSKLMGMAPAMAEITELQAASSKGEPTVLIYHTHGTEAYSENSTTNFRTDNKRENVVAVGDTLSVCLTELGIENIHIRDMFDNESWSGAYDRSTASVREILKKYPTVKYVFDVHRDCIGNDTDGYIRTQCTYNGYDTAQLMFVCGTDEGGSGHSTWEDNLSFVLKLQSKLWNKNSSLMRSINLRKASFYQDVSDGATIVEFGTCANSLTEAKRSAVVFAVGLREYLYTEKSPISEEELFLKYCTE